MESFDLDLLTTMLLDSPMTLRELADVFETEEKILRKFIKEHKLGWIRKNKGFASRGQAALTAIMRKLLPGEEIRSEEFIGERLRLDVYCPKFKIAAEFHGSQHFEYNGFFHKDYDDFLRPDFMHLNS